MRRALPQPWLAARAWPARVSAAAALVALSLALAGCGGKVRGTYEGNVYKNGPIAFRLPPPPSSWRQVEVNDASLAFRDDAHHASVLLNARCTTADDRTPLVALTNHLLMGATERDYQSQETIPFDGREAMHTKLKAKWDGVPMGIDVFVLAKDGCTYDFVYFGPEGSFEGGAAAFEAFVKGFRTLPGSGVVG